MDGFEIGDRVVCVDDRKRAVGDGLIYVGMTGTVMDLYEDYCGDGGNAIGVEWDERHTFMHNLGGSITSNRGWYVRPEAIDLVDGDTTDFEANMDIDDLL